MDISKSIETYEIAPGVEEHKPTYGAPAQTYKFAVPLSLLENHSTPERLFIAPPLFEKK